MTRFSQWLAELREAHDKARAGGLDAQALAAHLRERDQLLNTLLVAQQISFDYHRPVRQAMRISWALPITLALSSGQVRAVTLDVSAGGFSTLLGAQPPADEEIAFTLRLPGGESISGSARVVAATAQPGNVRASFSFAKVAEADVERVRAFLFEKVLGVLAPPRSRAPTSP